MKLQNPLLSVIVSRSGVVAACVAILGCANTPIQPAASKYALAERCLNKARSTSAPTEQRIALYLEAAADCAALLGSGSESARAEKTYDAVATELTVLLNTADGGHWWNHSESVSNGSTLYQLRFAPGIHDQVWAPDYFTSFKPANQVRTSALRKVNVRDGVGGELVGVRQPAQRDPFMGPRGIITSPVTAVLDFRGQNATLSLLDPRIQSTVKVETAVQPLAADFSAPLLYYKRGNELWEGFMGALNVGAYMSKTGLFFAQPYDPDRIPLIFVHGLISTPQMWFRVANQLDADPVVRARYQYWVFGYPTGNPLAYSSLRFREELAKLEQTYPGHRPIVLIGHSMGGLLSQMQVTTVTRADWVRTVGKPAAELLDSVAPDNIIHQALVWDANPHIHRVVFICTPHRGSDMAIQGIGQLAMRLIALPSSLISQVNNEVKGQISAFTGGSKRMPNTIFSLSPKNPTLIVMDKVPITVPYHSIIGDRGKGNSPNSSDGVVPYWSSHMDGAQSQLIVPGPHGSCELPQTIAELDRILLLNLKTPNP